MALYKWGWCVWEDVEWAVLLSLPTVYVAVQYSVRSCVVHVKYCNHLLAVDMMVRHVGDCGVHVVGKTSKDIGMGVRKGTVVSFVPTLFGCFLGIPSLYVFSFFFYVFL